MIWFNLPVLSDAEMLGFEKTPKTLTSYINSSQNEEENEETGSELDKILQCINIQRKRQSMERMYERSGIFKDSAY